MRGTTVLLVFGLLLSFCQAQVHKSAALASYKSGLTANAPGVLMLLFPPAFQAEAEAEEAVAEEEHVELFTTTQAKMAAATSDFGYNLFRALASREAGNVFLAPISVSAVLTQLSMGEHTNTHHFFHG